jgi:hypothetical protein
LLIFFSLSLSNLLIDTDAKTYEVILEKNIFPLARSSPGPVRFVKASEGKSLPFSDLELVFDPETRGMELGASSCDRLDEDGQIAPQVVHEEQEGGNGDGSEDINLQTERKQH